MNPRFFDVLHHASQFMPIKEGIDVNLDGVVQEVIYQQWARTHLCVIGAQSLQVVL